MPADAMLDQEPQRPGMQFRSRQGQMPVEGQVAMPENILIIDDRP